MPDRLESNTRTVMVFTLLSRFAGLARDAVLSRFFGVTELMSAFWMAFLIPNLFRRLFGEGALGAAYLPVYSELSSSNRDHAGQLASLLLAGLVVILGSIVVLGESVLFLFFSMGEDNSTVLWLMMVMLPYMPLVCIVAMLGAMLQVHGRFGPPAAAPLLLNGAMIVTAVVVALLSGESSPHSRLLTIGAIAGSVVLAGILQVAWMLWSLRGKVQWTWNRADASGPIRKVIHATLPMLLGVAVLQLNVFIDSLIASYPVVFGTEQFLNWQYPLDTGAMAVLSFAQRLYQFPLGVFAIAVATAIYPLLASQNNDDGQFGHTVRRGLRLVMFIGLPASIGLVLVREPLTALIYQGWAFTGADTNEVSTVLLGYAVAIWAYSANGVLARVCYAKLDMKTPVRIAVQMVVLNLILNMTLIWTPLRTSGLAWSTAICAVLQTGLLLRAIRPHVQCAIDDSVRSSTMRSFALALLMGLGVGAVMLVLDDPETFWPRLLNIGILVSVGTAIYGGGAMLLRMPELRLIFSRN
jgi:putative peptidoglycan lipid II flippase